MACGKKKAKETKSGGLNQDYCQSDLEGTGSERPVEEDVFSESLIQEEQ